MQYFVIMIDKNKETLRTKGKKSYIDERTHVCYNEMTDEKQVVSWRQLHIPGIEMPLGGLVTLQKRG